MVQKSTSRWKLSLSRWRPWLELVRLPNLFTVPGDPLVGALLGAASRTAAPVPNFWQLLAVVAVSLCLYAHGLIVNDLRDLGEDRRHRPERPLPRGAIALRHARLAAGLLLLVGLLIAALAGRRVLLTTLVLAVAVYAYNTSLKRNRRQGALSMGFCRGLSLLVGAALVGWPLPTLVAAVGLAGYIAAVTWIADRENQRSVFGRGAWGPAVAMAVTGPVVLLAVAVTSNVAALPALALLSLALLAPLRLGHSLSQGVVNPATTRRAIGLLILSLIAWQAAYLAAVAAWLTVGLVLLGGAAATVLRRQLAIS